MMARHGLPIMSNQVHNATAVLQQSRLCGADRRLSIMHVGCIATSAIKTGLCAAD